jgi:hypothetical protein
MGSRWELDTEQAGNKTWVTFTAKNSLWRTKDSKLESETPVSSDALRFLGNLYFILQTMKNFKGWDKSRLSHLLWACTRMYLDHCLCVPTLWYPPLQRCRCPHVCALSSLHVIFLTPTDYSVHPSQSKGKGIVTGGFQRDQPGNCGKDRLGKRDWQCEVFEKATAVFWVRDSGNVNSKQWQ